MAAAIRVASTLSIAVLRFTGLLYKSMRFAYLAIVPIFCGFLGCEPSTTKLSVQVKPAYGDREYRNSAEIAAGGIENAVHSADVKITLPEELSDSDSVKLKLKGGLGGEHSNPLRTMKNKQAILYLGGYSIIAGEEITLTGSDITGETLVGKLISSNEAESVRISATLNQNRSILTSSTKVTFRCPEMNVEVISETEFRVRLTVNGDPIENHDVAVYIQSVYVASDSRKGAGTGLTSYQAGQLGKSNSLRNYVWILGDDKPHYLIGKTDSNGLLAGKYQLVDFRVSQINFSAEDLSCLR